jgi:hypothetical protein
MTVRNFSLFLSVLVAAQLALVAIKSSLKTVKL